MRIHPSECEYFKCDCGEKMVKFYRAEKLKMLREVVVIIFNKFQMKDNRWFPQELTFGAKGGSTLNYRLVGKIEHSGTRFGGHYWAQSFRGKSWTRLNDSGVTVGNSAHSSDTFMVAYHIVDPLEAAEEKSSEQKMYDQKPNEPKPLDPMDINALADQLSFLTL